MALRHQHPQAALMIFTPGKNSFPRAGVLGEEPNGGTVLICPIVEKERLTKQEVTSGWVTRVRKHDDPVYGKPKREWSRGL